MAISGDAVLGQKGRSSGIPPGLSVPSTRWLKATPLAPTTPLLFLFFLSAASTAAVRGIARCVEPLHCVRFLPAMACSCAELRIRLQSSLCWPMRKRMPLDALYLYGNLGTFRGRPLVLPGALFALPAECKRAPGIPLGLSVPSTRWLKAKRRAADPTAWPGPSPCESWSGRAAWQRLISLGARPARRCRAATALPARPALGWPPALPARRARAARGGPPRRRRRPGPRGTAAPLLRRARRQGWRRPGCGACGPCWCSGWWAASCWPPWRAAPGRSPGAAPRGAS